MTTCPRCRREHKGPRDLTLIFDELLHVVDRARQMPMVTVREYLRTQALGLGLELSDFCTDCLLSEIAASMVHIETVTQTEQAMQAVADPNHVCLIIPLFPKRDLLDIGATFDSERK